METTVDGSFLQEEDHIRVKSTGETGTVNAVSGGVVYVLMDTTHENRLFAASIEDDADIELVTSPTTSNFSNHI